MKLRLLFAACWLVFGSVAAGQDSSKALVRCFNDSARAVNFYVDSQFGCSVPANPEENNAYCDIETSVGKHAVRVKGAKLLSQSCELYVLGRNGPDAGAEAHLSKGVRLRCLSYAVD
jgi:hypothetical protein